MAQNKKRRGQRHRRTLSTRLQNVGLVVLAVLTFAGASYALSRGSDSSGSTASGYPTPSPTRQVTGALFFGDSIVEGCCRSNAASPTMASIAARSLGWNGFASGAGGTGYLATATVNGETRKTFPDRIAGVVNGSSYDIVVIVGGNNDQPVFREQPFRAAVRQTIAEVKRALPKAKIVLVGPYVPNGVGDKAIRDAEKAEAEAAGARWIDPVAERWMVGHPELISSDKFHPNDAGQAYLGERLTTALRALRLGGR